MRLAPSSWPTCLSDSVTDNSVVKVMSLKTKAKKILREQIDNCSEKKLESLVLQGGLLTQMVQLKANRVACRIYLP